MKLREILADVPCAAYDGETEVCDIAYDSRAAKPGTIFVALRGVQDGHAFCADAYRRGCRLFAVEYRPADLPDDAVTVVCENTRRALSRMSANFFRHPDREVRVVGITGTNGKTTLTYLLKSTFDTAGYPAGLIGTNGAEFGGRHYPTINTTPQSYEMFRLLREMADAGCRYAFVEASSLGIQQERVADIRFYAAVFTNFSPDHVGGHEHKTVEEYLACKLQLFKQCDFAVLNRDDAQYPAFRDACACETVSYGTSPEADYIADEVEPVKEAGAFGVRFLCRHNGASSRVFVSMPGSFSAENALVAFALCERCGVSPEAAREALAEAGAPGRLEHFALPNGADVFLDYAHNGGAVANVCAVLREYPHDRLIAVIGCVGGRAQIRRRGVAEACAAGADMTWFTADDPNFEDPAAICAEVAGYCRDAGGVCAEEPDRATAVQTALGSTHAGDFVVLLGKGHETAQKIGGELVPYSDVEQIELFRRSLQTAEV